MFKQVKIVREDVEDRKFCDICERPAVYAVIVRAFKDDGDFQWTEVHSTDVCSECIKEIQKQLSRKETKND